MPNSISRVREVIEGIKNSFEAAKDTFNLRNSTMQNTLKEQISSIDTLIESKKNSWTEIRLKDLEDKKATKIERLDELKELANPTTPSSKQKVRQAVKRQAKAFQEIH